jgi:LuxR family maltose regulon positive regulatory protein
VATIVAPAGYGKTTLLAEWAAAETRRVAWVSVDDRDNDPVRLLRHVVTAVDRIEPLDRRLFTVLRAPTRSTWYATADRAVRTVASCIRPYVLVLDNVDLLRSRESRRLLAALVDQIPRGSTIALAGRVMPKLRVAALRERGDLAEIGVAELALNNREARLLLQAADADLTDAETDELVERSEGWPAGLYLGALSFRDATVGSAPPVHFGGDDRYLADYLATEYVSHLRQPELRFLRRTSILGALSGPLCDAVVQRDGSARELEKIKRANLFLTPLDRRGWFRFHELFRDVLLGELAKEEPELVQTLHRRAADWYEANGDLESALDHADAAGDVDRMATIIPAIAFPVSCRGRVATLDRWLGRLGPSQLERYPALAVHGSRLHALRGRTAEAERWLEVAEHGARSRRRGAAALRPRIAVVRAALCRRGPRQMLSDANAALLKLPRESDWRPAALLLRGTAAMLLGARKEADYALGEAALQASARGWTETRMLATGQLSLLAGDRGDVGRADELAADARRVALDGELEDYPTFTITLASSAHASLRHGRWAEARELLDAAGRVKTGLTEALPWLAVGVRIELARCYLTLRDLDGARALLGEIDAILERRPDLGVLGDRARRLAQDLRTLALVEEHARLGLTPAELRLLPLLATHLSFREIAEQLRVSRNTVKTQAISIYRKLGVTGRSGAIAEAARLDPGRVAA